VQIATGIETELAKTTSYATIGNQIIGGDNHMYLITRRAEFHGLCPWVNEKAAI
jgi:hypothetical protein